MKEVDPVVSAKMREWGKLGGRKKTAPHVDGWKGCRCFDCRREKAANKAANKAGGGASKNPVPMVHVSETGFAPEGLSAADQITEGPPEVEASPSADSGVRRGASGRGGRPVDPIAEALKRAAAIGREGRDFRSL